MGWARRLFRRHPGSKVDIELQEGTRGRWRWEAYEVESDFDAPFTGRCVAVCPVRGFDERHDAQRAANKLFGNRIREYRIISVTRAREDE